MDILPIQDLRSRLRKKELDSVYLLFGPETFQRNLAIKTITDLALKDVPLREFNDSEFSLNHVDVETAIAAAEQLPMMGDKRVVKVVDLVVSANKQACNLKESSEYALKAYLENPSPSSVVIFAAEEIDKRLKMAKLLIGNCVAVEFPRLSEQDLLRFTREKIKELGATSDEKAIRQIASLVGNDLRKLTLELEKLAIAAHPEGVISFELVDELVPASRDLSNFELTDHLLAQQRTRALQVLKELLDDGAEPLMILGLIGSNFHRLLLAKELMDEGLPRREIVSNLRLPYSKQEPFLALARRTEREKFSKILRRIAQTDLAIKTSVASPRLQIEMLVCELAVLE